MRDGGSVTWERAVNNSAALKHGERERERNHGNGNGIRNLSKKVPSDRFEKKNISNDNEINKQIKKKRHK